MRKCPHCIALLGEAQELFQRSIAIDDDVTRLRASGRGDAGAIAVIARYDADLEQWQARVDQHLSAEGVHA